MNASSTRLLLLLTILLAFALRIFALDVQSLWYDEGVTATIAQLDFVSLTRWTARDIQPPLYYYIVSAWGNLTDWREWHLRWPSVWFGVLTVPLLVALTARFTRTKWTLILAAFFAALHPLLIYYSQEARMYSMLTALVILCAILLIRQSWVAYVLVAVAAVYTHYFAFFLLLAIGMAYLLQLYQSNNLATKVRPFLLANLAIFVLYIPWFGALFTRLAVDTSYLPGQVKLIELVRHALITFIAGETILESRAGLPLIELALVTVAAILWLAWRSKSTLVYALCWVLIPCVLILLLTLFVPKFNARYVMIALPGLLLLWSVAAGDMIDSPRVGWRTIGIVLVMLLTLNFGSAIRNWFGDEAFTKAQWREAAQHLRDHKSDDEAVVLVSGHAWPIWDYYAPDMPAVRLPNLEILDTNATLDYVQSGSILREALAGEQRAWLVRWQEQFVDPMETVALHLESAATIDPNRAEFWQLQVDHFTDLRADQISATPPIAGQEPMNFGNQLVLLGSSTNAADDLLLYWMLHETYAGDNVADYRIAGELRTLDNLPYQRLRDRRPVGYDFPTTRWRPGQINVSRIPALDWAGSGALAGDYQLSLSVYDVLDESAVLDLLAPNGAPLGKLALLSLPLRLPILSGGGTVTGYDDLSAALAAKVGLSTKKAEPGESIRVDINWLAQQPLPELDTLWIQWIGGDQTFEAQQPLAWPANVTSLDSIHVHTVHELRVPVDAPAGDYLLSLSVGEEGTVQNEIVLLPSTRTFEVPQVAQSIGATFGDEIELIGIVESTVTDNDKIADDKTSIVLAWRAAAVPRIDYTATLQILNDAGQPIHQSDLALPRGSSNWLAGQVETQLFILDRQPLLDQRMIVALYDAKNNFQRLILPNGADHLVLP